MSLHLVVLDTNILVSAGVHSGGLEAQLIERVLDDDLILLTCPAVVAEYVDVLNRPKFRTFGFPPLWLYALLRLAHHRTEDPPIWSPRLPDVDDGVFLALAHAMDATLVTGNLRHFPAEARMGTKVCNARAFLAALEAK